MAIGTMTSKGQITVPKEVRDALGLAAGTRVVFRRTVSGEYVLSVVPRRLADLAGSLHYDGPPLTLAAMDDAIIHAALEAR